MNMLLHSPWLVLMGKLSVVLALGWLGHGLLSRGNPRYRMYWWRGTACALAAVALLGLVPGVLSVPVMVDASQNGRPAAPKTAPAGARPSVPRADSPRVASSQQSAAEIAAPKSPGQKATREGTVVAAAPPGGAAEDGTTTPAVSPVRLNVFLGAGWAIGVILLLCRWGIGHILMWRWLRTARGVPDALRELVESCNGTGLRADVVKHENARSPLIYGVWHPVILLPSWLCEETHRGDWRGVLAHELSHLRSRDLFWQAVIRSVRTALWWHPLAWGIARAHALACEYKADLDAAASVGETGGYLRMLARVALAVTGPVPSAGLAMARRSDVSRRVERLKSTVPAGPPRKRWLAAATAGGVVFAALVGMTGFVAAEVGEPVQPAAKPESRGTPMPRAAAKAKTGVLTGVITFDGDAPKPKLLHRKGDPKVKRPLRQFDVPDESLLVDAKTKGIANVVFFLQKKPVGYKSVAPEKPVEFTMKNGRFSPHVLFVQARQSIGLRNADTFIHNVHSMPLASAAINQIVAPNKRSEVKYARRDKLPVKVVSDLYPSMRAYHVVLDHPFAAVTDQNGRVTIKGLPPGKHRFVIWHEKAGFLDRRYEVTIKPGKIVKFSLSYEPERFQ